MSFTVPCGECLSCQYDYGDQWTLRIHHELNDCLQEGGTCVFITLTYADSFLPYFYPCGKKISCFNREHIVKFLRELRRSIGNLSVRHFITCEYGDNTLRSHYHGLLFFSRDAAYAVECMRPNLSRTQAFKDFIQSFWPYGFCRWSKPLSKKGPGIFVDSPAAGSYVSKYVSKCVSFRSDIKDMFAQRYGDNKYSRSLYKKFRAENYNFFARHYQSLHFGDSALRSFDISLYPDLVVPSPFRILGKNGLEKKFPISRYQFRKLTHDFDPLTKSWQLNEYGLYCKKLRLKSLFDSSYLSFIRCCNPTIYSSLCGCFDSSKRSLSEDFVDKLHSLGLSCDKSSFEKLFYFNYISRFEVDSDGSKYLYPDKPSLDLLLDFVDYSYYNPIYHSEDTLSYENLVDPNGPFYFKPLVLSGLNLELSKLFDTFVKLNSHIKLNNIQNRYSRDLKYKSLRDTLYNLNS